MRQILSISLPFTELGHAKKTAKKRGYSSVSEYIKNLIQEDTNLITEEELLKDVAIARREYKAGKGGDIFRSFCFGPTYGAGYF